jgi:ABC-type sugar transport system ATPase subunit
MSAAFRSAATPASASDRDQPPFVVLNDLQKDYPGVRALGGVSMDLRRGEVHALVGENGAGKSTLIRILSGDVRPDGGTLSVGGETVVFAGPMDARKHGIVTIFQELMIVPELSVAENIFLGNEPESFGLFYSRRRAERMAADILETLVKGIGIRPSQRAGSLSTAQKQLIEIARALVLRAPVLVMDEPTAALSENEAVALRRLIVRLRSEGTSILYVSHRLDEIMEIADRVTVLRGGERIATLDIEAITNTSELLGLMIGRPIAQLFPPRNEDLGEVVFSVSSLTRQGAFENISFNVRAGEVVGFAGLVGAGRTEVMRAIFGADVLDSGEIRKSGRVITIHSPRDAIASGIAYLPEDRKDHGLVLSMSGVENLVMASLERSGFAGLVSWKAVGRSARSVAEKLHFTGQLDAMAGTASGGNQQKLVIGKWVLTQADILIFDEPTRGIDVGAKAEVYRLIHRLASEGAAVILVSSELPELMNVCHRIYAMSGGRIWDEIPQEEFDEQRILAGAFVAHMASKPTAFHAGAA